MRGGYYYDEETGFYWLSSRYYDPEVGRFINADDVSYLGADGTPISYNLFSYCGNNPVMGYDPSGHWDWGGVIAGLMLGAAAVITVATGGVATPLGMMIAGAALTTGAVTTYAAATDAAMVLDVSVTIPLGNGLYIKEGISTIVDFKSDKINIYDHTGGGIGSGGGVSYSVGIVENYDDPMDYAEHFVDVNAGYNIGVDHCWNPLEKHKTATQATAISFSSGFSCGVGYDYYGKPRLALKW